MKKNKTTNELRKISSNLSFQKNGISIAGDRYGGFYLRKDYIGGLMSVETLEEEDGNAGDTYACDFGEDHSKDEMIKDGYIYVRGNDPYSVYKKLNEIKKKIKS